MTRKVNPILARVFTITFGFFALSIMAPIAPAFACDLCTIYSSAELRPPQENTFHFDVSEDFEGYSKLKDEGESIDKNTDDQTYHSFVTTLLAGYDITDMFGLEVRVPFVNHTYTRLAADGIEDTSDGGIADMSVLAKISPINSHDEDSAYIFQIYGGLKLPTGDTEFLKEEKNPVAGQYIYGHDLALGSGSIDFPVGASYFMKIDHFVAALDAQYTFRTEGDYDYQYADDFLWKAGLGFTRGIKDHSELTVKANISGEDRDRDTLNGNHVENSGVTTLYLGPEVLVKFSETLSAHVGLDFPIDQDNNGIQVLSDHNVRVALLSRF